VDRAGVGQPTPVGERPGAGRDRYTAAVPLSVITFQFDALAHVGDWNVRWETIGVAVAIFVALLAAAALAGRVRLPAHPDDPPGTAVHLRRDDLLFIALGIVPGAVIGGRLAFVALHLDYYRANSGMVLDPGSGGLALSGAVVLGAVSGGLVARLFDAPVSRWYGIAVLPMLVVLALGKGAEILGGSGQGLPAAADWATRYLGTGPWGSLGPDIPSVPAQALEALGVAALVVAFAVAWALGASRRADGRLFAVALGGWAIVRFAVASTWRDPVVVGPLKAEQVIDLAILGLAVVVLAVLAVRAARAPGVAAGVEPAEPGLAWPDPETRRRF